MKVKNFIIEPCSRKEIQDFVEHWHYSNSINGVISDYCFKMTHEGNLIGAAIFGRLAMAGVSKKYGTNVTELRRLCCIDETPKNAESRLIGASLRWLKKNTDIETVISYADPNFNHQGVIYQATNFKNIGKTSGGRVIMYLGRLYHDKCIRTKHKGELKPFAKRIKEALETGEAFYLKRVPKIIYEYKLI